MRKAINHYEAALKEAFPSGATGNVFHHWNEARKLLEEAEKQEPVAWVVDGEIKVRLDMAGKLYYSETNVYAAPVHASDISQERVDETAKDRHISYVCPNCHWSLNRQEPDDDIYDIWVEQGTCQQNRQVAPSGFECPRCGHCCQQKEWVGLTDEEREQVRSSAGYNQFMSAGEYAETVQRATEAKLKEKNVPQP